MLSRVRLFVILVVLAMLASLSGVNAQATLPNVSSQLVPLHGAWWGDYVSSNPADVPVRETLSQRRFDLVSFYHDWNDTFPTAGEKTLAAGGRFLKLNFTGRDYANSANNVNWC